MLPNSLLGRKIPFGVRRNFLLESTQSNNPNGLVTIFLKIPC
jgi:hypothetical protein